MTEKEQIYNTLLRYCITKKKVAKKCIKYYIGNYEGGTLHNQGIKIEFFIEDKKYYISKYITFDGETSYELTSPDRVRKIKANILIKRISEIYKL